MKQMDKVFPSCFSLIALRCITIGFQKNTTALLTAFNGPFDGAVNVSAIAQLVVALAKKNRAEERDVDAEE